MLTTAQTEEVSLATDPDMRTVIDHLLAYNRLDQRERKLHEAAVRIDYVERILDGTTDTSGQPWTRERIAQVVLEYWFGIDNVPCDAECRRILRL